VTTFPAAKTYDYASFSASKLLKSEFVESSDSQPSMLTWKCSPQPEGVAMRQLPGQKCVHCGETIAGVLDAEFCPECGCPVHKRCLAGSHGERGICEHCGVPEAESAAFQERERVESVRRVRESQRTQARSDVSLGVAFLTSGIVFTAISYWIATQSQATYYLIASGLIGVGLYRLFEEIDQLRSLRTDSHTRSRASDVPDAH